MWDALFENPEKLRERGRKLKEVLERGEIVRVKAKNGTDITFLIKNREIDVDDGLYREKGAFGNLPAGEVCLAPIEGTANGKIVIDSMRDGREIFARKGTKIIVENGRAIDISDKRCKLARFFKAIKNATNLAEFGIGTNSKARIIGHVLQDEKVYGTCHFAFGDNKSFGGKVSCEIHLDGIIVKPDIWIDGKLIMKKGRLKI
jgi:leucyl aminopeptidase (aminopeptidase T)